LHLARNSMEPNDPVLRVQRFAGVFPEVAGKGPMRIGFWNQLDLNCGFELQ